MTRSIVARWFLAGFALLALVAGAAADGPFERDSPTRKIARQRAEAEQALHQCRLAVARERENVAAARERLRRLQEKSLLLEGAVEAFRLAEQLAENAVSTSTQSPAPTGVGSSAE
ncbi:hypothetical protein JW916_10555 [Candidatus Sumerlaeota bacterium]|nr:hypothetical protein [Candidatus Sumerlaeota bacterium]